MLCCPQQKPPLRPWRWLLDRRSRRQNPPPRWLSHRPPDPFETGSAQARATNQAVQPPNNTWNVEYVGQWGEGINLRVVDIGDGAHPTEVAAIAIIPAGRCVGVMGDVAYIRDGSQGPWEITYGASMIDAYLYASVHWWDLGQGLEIMNLSNPSEPSDEGYVHSARAG